MCGEHRQSRRDLGRVEVVHVDDVFPLEQVRADVVEVQACRRGLEQHVHGLSEQLERSRQDEHADEEPCDGVGAAPTGDGDDDRGDDDGDGSEGVVEDFEERGSEVEVRVPAGGEHQDRRDVTDEADDAEDEQSPGGDLGGCEQPLDPFDEDEQPDCEQDRCLRGGGEHLGAGEPPGALRGCGSSCEVRCDECGCQPAGVGEHVCCVDEEREAVGRDGSDDLGDEDRCGDAEGDCEPAAVHGVRVDAVIVWGAHASCSVLWWCRTTSPTVCSAWKIASCTSLLAWSFARR
eukprot:GHVO01035415.1.p3 GENE.GHVO01035415.1~~GHVO01035415.1.p3  ORF type:complete len:290 (+),score=34.50 GHVO01035415.1:180-1049(+)